MLQAAWEYIVANRSGRTDIWICSDLQAADWNAESGIWNQIRSGFLEHQQTVQFHLLSYDQSIPTIVRYASSSCNVTGART